MSATAVDTATRLPVGNWKLDPTHSSASFAVKHMGVATFRGRFDHFDATLTVATTAPPNYSARSAPTRSSSRTRTSRPTSGAPDFFDTERYPELRFVSRSLRRDGEELIADGELTIKDKTHAVEARGTITDPTETLGGAVKIGITLETIIDRTKFGLEWNAPLPKGGFAVANEVKLTVELELAQAEE